MGRNKSKNKPATKKKGAAAPVAQEKSPPLQGVNRGYRVILRDVALGLLVCLVLFAFAELSLRAAGLFKQDIGEDPYVGFSGIIPLFEVKDGVARVAKQKLRYFNESSFSVVKPPDVIRIFCFGGSTTYGHPFDQRTSFSRWLQELLTASHPDKRFEVINVGGISYASYRIVPLIKETLQYQPDVMIIYTGHNEFLERRTYSSIIDKGSTIVAIKAALEQFHLFRGLEKAIHTILPPGDTDANQDVSTEAKKTKAMLQPEVSALLDRSAGLELYHRDDIFAQGVVRHFAYNLEAMIQLCKAQNVPVILVEPPCNLKDFSPFKSEHDRNMTVAEQKKYAASLEKAHQQITEGAFEAAEAELRPLLKQDPLYAETHFLMGRAKLGLGQFEEAQKYFVQARDLDVCPLRVISPIADKIREVASKNHVPLIPFVDIVNNRVRELGDPSGIPGNESFMDHVHPNIPLHQLLAEVLMGAVQETGVIGKGRPLSSEEKEALYAKAMAGMDSQFMALRDLNLAKTLRWAGKKQEAKAALLRVAPLMPENPEVHKMLGSFALEEGDFETAIASYKKAVALAENDPDMKFALAVAFYNSGQIQKARETYEEILSSGASLAEVYANLGTIYLQQGLVDEAWRTLQDGMNRCKDCTTLYSPYALVQAVMGRPREAIPWMQKAVDAEPGNPKSWYNLAGMYALAGSPDMAIQTLNRAVDLGYSNYRNASSDPIFASIRSDPRFQKVLDRIRP